MGSAGSQLQAADRSGQRRASTGELPSGVGSGALTARKKRPENNMSEKNVRRYVKKNVRNGCQKICQKKRRRNFRRYVRKRCQKICQKRMSEGMSGKSIRKERQKKCQKECHKICQKECQKIWEDLPRMNVSIELRALRRLQATGRLEAPRPLKTDVATAITAILA